MARIDKRRTAGARANARGVSHTAARQPSKRGRTSGSIEDTMFFPRLRRHTKWMFVALALVFSLGFVFFGVGASGTGLGDLFRNHNTGGGGTSVSSALKETQKNPKSLQAWQDLATAYETKGDIDNAVNAQVQAVAIAPKNVDALNTLASLYRSQGVRQQNIAQDAQLQVIFSGTISPAGQGLTVKGTPVFNDPLATAATADATATYTNAIGAANTSLQNTLATYQKVAQVTPNDPNAQIAIATAAQQIGSTQAEITAYRRYLALAPDAASAALVRKQLKQLTAPPKKTKAKAAKSSSG
jgi:hypothetical protein